MRIHRLIVESLEDRTTPAALPDGFGLSLLTENLTLPTALQEAPDGRLFVTEKGGAVRVVKPNGTLVATPAITLDVETESERGLLGITIDPNFATNRFVYVYYTVPPATPEGNAHNRISRFTMVGDTINANTEFVLEDLDPLEGSHHNGGALHFGTDGRLYVAVGDNASPGSAQSLTSHFGKILRFNADGTIPSNNPIIIEGFDGQTTVGKYRAIYAVGLRNPFTFAIQPLTGRTLINDVGQNAFEEINDLAPGRNYGWPSTEGNFNTAQFFQFTPPTLSYPHGGGTNAGFAITGGTFYNPTTASFPADYVGDYFFADYVNGWIRRYDEATNTSKLFASDLTNFRIVDLDTTRDGDLLVLDLGFSGGAGEGKIYRISRVFSPQFATQPLDAIVRPGGPVTFVSLADGTPSPTYQWQRNGENIPGATSASYTLQNPTLANNGDTFRAIATNSNGSATSRSAALTVTTNLVPVISILTPTVGTTVSAGTTITYSGAATDPEDGMLGGPAFTWRVDYFTGAVARPVILETTGLKAGTFTIETTTPYTLPDVFYRITLKVVDSFGNIATATRDVLPQTASVFLSSQPDGVLLTVDGQPIQAPTLFVGVVGILRQIGAPLTVVSGTETLNFSKWSDGNTNRIRTISTPAGGGQYEAIYSANINNTTIPPPPLPLPPPPPNTAPSIQSIADKTIAQAAVGSFDFTISDAESAASTLSISATSSNEKLLPVSRIAIDGTSSSRTLNATPVTGLSGTTTIVLTVTDTGGLTATESFVITVVPPVIPAVVPPVIPAVVPPVTPAVVPPVTPAVVPPVIPPVVPPTPVAPVLIGSGPGRTASIRAIDPATGETISTFDLSQLATPFGSEIRVTSGDLNGDGIAEVIAGSGPGTEPRVVIYDGKTGAVLGSALVFESTFTGGIFVAAGDIDGDGVDDLIVSPDEGGGPRVRVFRSGNFDRVIADFFGIDDENFRGGARIATGDVNADGHIDLIVAAGIGGGPRVAGFDGRSLVSGTPTKVFADFFAFEDTLRNGAFVGLGDLNGDGRDDLITGAGPGGGPRVIAFNGAELAANNAQAFLANFFAGDPESRGGVRVSSRPVAGSAADDLIVGTAPGTAARVIVYRGADLTPDAQPTELINVAAFEDDFAGGVFVG